jgi:hypothetical protein
MTKGAGRSLLMLRESHAMLRGRIAGHVNTYVPSFPTGPERD